MIEERFAAGDSWLHRADPQVKITAAVLFSIIVAVASSPSMLGAALLFSFIAAASSKPGFRLLLHTLLVVNGFVVFIWLIMPFSFPGEPAFSAGPLTASAEGIRYCAILTMKSNAIILANLGLLSTSSLVSLAHALSHMKIPAKLIHIFFFCLRYIHVLQMEYNRLRNAMKIRCFRPGTNMHTYRSYANLVGMLLVNSYERSNRIYNAMKCRGFNGRYYVLDHFEHRRSDTILMAVLLIVIAALALLEWGKLFF